MAERPRDGKDFPAVLRVFTRYRSDADDRAMRDAFHDTQRTATQIAGPMSMLTGIMIYAGAMTGMVHGMQDRVQPPEARIAASAYSVVFAGEDGVSVSIVRGVDGYALYTRAPGENAWNLVTREDEARRLTQAAYRALSAQNNAPENFSRRIEASLWGAVAQDIEANGYRPAPVPMESRVAPLFQTAVGGAAGAAAGLGFAGFVIGSHFSGGVRRRRPGPKTPR